MTKFLLTATPPTPNGDLHVGHLSGPYIAADVHRRYLRMRGHEAFYVCGGDDHQSFVHLKALQQEQDPAQLTEHCNREIVETLAAVDAPLDGYVRPLSSSHHDAFVLEFFRKLHGEGKLVARSRPAPWCTTCDQYLFEAHVSGRCPYCGADSDGNVCEACARPNQCVDLLDPRCKACGATPEAREVERLFFPLEEYREPLARYWETVPMSAHLEALCEAMLNDGLPEIPVTHPSDWGLPVPVPGFEGQTIYAWFEMAPGYLSATQEMLEGLGRPEEWRDFWQGDGRVVQFFGYDNGYFHAVLFPAEWIAYDPDLRLPEAFVVNEFYQLEGAKFSTSRGHAIWGKEATHHLHPDVIRFFLAWDRPEAEQTNFELEAFRATVEAELLGSWRGWLAELCGRVEAHLPGATPEPGIWTPAHRELLARLDRHVEQMEVAYAAASYSGQQAARLLSSLVREARTFGAAESYWGDDPRSQEKRRTALALELTAADVLARTAIPLLPSFGERLLQELGRASPEPPSWPRRPVEVIPPGCQLDFSSQPYFAGTREGLRSLLEARGSLALAS